MKIGLYKHYKGGLYNVIGVAKHSETLEEMVVYKSIHDPERKDKELSLWVRPIKMFNENVEIDGNIIPRFQFLPKQEDN